MAVKKASPTSTPPARRHLVDVGEAHLEQHVDPARVDHWTRELLKFGTKPEELRRAIAALEIVNQLRDTDLEAQREIASELRANCDAIVVIASPDVHRSAYALTDFHRVLKLDAKTRVFFEKPQSNTAWLNGLLQHLLQQGSRLGAVIVKYGSTNPLLEAAQEGLEEIISLRHGADEARRRILLVGEANATGRETYRKVPFPDRMVRPFTLFSAVGCVPLNLAGVDAFQFAEGARSFCRALEKNYLADEPCLRFTATRLHLIAEKNLREVFLQPDPGLDGLAQWWEALFEPTSAALGNPSPASVSRDCLEARLTPGEPPSEFGITLEWEEDDSPGQLLPLDQCSGPFPHLSLSFRKRDAFSLGAASAFLACSASMTHRVINLPFGK